MTTSKQPRALVVLHLPIHVPDLIKSGEAFVTAMTGNPAFLSPTPPLTSVTALLTGLNLAETAMKTRAHGTREARDKARVDLVSALRGLKGYVQLVADAAGDQAEAIITSAGMTVRKPVIRNKPDFIAKPGPTSGTVHLVAKAVARRASYEWEWSSDGGKTWIAVPGTLQAKTTVIGLPVAIDVQFRFRTVTRTGESDWSQVITFLVK